MSLCYLLSLIADSLTFLSYDAADDQNTTNSVSSFKSQVHLLRPGCSLGALPSVRLSSRAFDGVFTLHCARDHHKVTS
jgi:hypothetical protein